MHSTCTDWEWTPASIAYLAPFSPQAKAWAKAVFSEFAPKFVGSKLAVACMNFSETESAVDIENTLNEGRTIGVRAKLEGNEWVINGNKFWASNSGIADLNCVVCNMGSKCKSSAKRNKIPVFRYRKPLLAVLGLTQVLGLLSLQI
jgi:hypothetical protein